MTAVMMKGRSRKFSTIEFVFTACLVLVGCLQSCPSVSAKSRTGSEGSDNGEAEETKEKLLVIMLDGFRWDYYDQNKKNMNAFHNFLEEGVQAQWVEPIFPTLSYPSWTTISTGVFPETHGIIGNYMFDLNVTDPSQALFDLFKYNTTMKLDWWQNSEPIWTTATRYGKKAFLRYWSRCDVPVREVRPFECTGYRESRGVDSIKSSFMIAVEKLKRDFDLVMVYGEHLDNVGHKYGPNSEEMKKALKEVDDAFADLADKILDSNLEKKVNVIVVSDHGMTWTGEGSGVKYINLDDHVDKTEIFRSLDRGAVISIAPFAKQFQTVYDRLKNVPGLDVYMQSDIPEEWHYKKGRLVQDILVVAKPGYFIRGLQSSKQIPRDQDRNTQYGGTHGYAPKMQDMRAIFFANGPAFKKGIVHPPIHLEDIYQIFTRVLDVPAEPHNGSWSRVSGMLVNRAVSLGNSVSVLCTLALHSLLISCY